MKKKLRVGIVKLGTVAENDFRLDPEFYLGSDNDQEYEWSKYRLRPAVFKRFFKALWSVVKSRSRALWFRLSGRVRL